ncbi:MAG: adenylyl-sulfate kinase, partial [Rhodospirillales bacterium]|nr:adenylyl-sulfate kinase [Rhodospirillales bacterium]
YTPLTVVNLATPSISKGQYEKGLYVIICLTGLAASGKTTIGTEIVRQWKAKTPNVVFMDGDKIRKVLQQSEGEENYTYEGRHRIGRGYSDICAWLDSQGLNVVFCTIMFFDDIRTYNRKTFSKYFEVYIDVPMETLRKRDVKNL